MSPAHLSPIHTKRSWPILTDPDISIPTREQPTDFEWMNSGAVLQPMGQNPDAGAVPAEIHRHPGQTVRRQRRNLLIHNGASTLLPAGRV